MLIDLNMSKYEESVQWIDMFIGEMCRNRNIEKCSRIFRPWDLEYQDATVSTTTEDEIHKEIKNEDIFEQNNKYLYKSQHPSKIQPHIDKREDLERVDFQGTCEPVSSEISSRCVDSTKFKCNNFNGISQSNFDRVPPVPNYSFPADISQGNITQNLGIPPNEPLLLESLAHGYAFEEYVRVLEQEHQAKILNAKKKRPKKYKCPHCDVGFSNNGQLKGHIRIHTGERPFKCDEKDCGKTFTRNEELTRHKRIHSGLRPFPCGQCGKRFGRKDHLKKHCRTHFQPRGFYAVPVVLPYDAWATNYPFVSALPSLY